MAQTYKKTFIYSGEHKYYGELASSSSTNVIPNNGVTRITAASSYVLQGPYPGALVTIYATSVDAVINSVSTTAGSTGQVSFDDNGGTQKLNLLYDSTVKNTPMVTLLGESATQWRIMSVVPPAVNMVSSNAGVSVTT
jgi:hypothetical protein